MATVITGGNTQVGSVNRQFIKSKNKSFNTNTFNFNISVNIFNGTAPEHQEGVSNSDGDIHKLIDCLKSLAAASAGQTTQEEPGAVVPSQDQRTTKEVVRNRREKVPWLRKVLQRFLPKTIEDVTVNPDMKAVTESVCIVDSSGLVVKPGDAIYSDSIPYIYTGDGYAVRCLKSSRVERIQLNLTRPVKILTPLHGNVKLFPTELRVQRALQQVGCQCPANEGLPLDFVFWTFTGLSFPKGRQRGFDFNI